MHARFSLFRFFWPQVTSIECSVKYTYAHSFPPLFDFKALCHAYVSVDIWAFVNSPQY